MQRAKNVLGPGRRVYSHACGENDRQRRHPMDPPSQGLRRDKAATLNATPLRGGFAITFHLFFCVLCAFLRLLHPHPSP
jgi:hypothetical protein